jgi:hypothetical protein
MMLDLAVGIFCVVGGVSMDGWGEHGAQRHAHPTGTLPRIDSQG